MSIFIIVLELVRQIGLTLAVGSSTFALIFYFKAIQDGVMDVSERAFLHIVYKVLRIGLVGLVFFEITTALFAFSIGASDFLLSGEYVLRVLLLAMIITNAFLMDKHLMPMTIGPAIAGGSWYAYFLVHSGLFFGMTFNTLFLLYTGWLFFFWCILYFLRKLYVPRLPQSTR